ncbi:hypothetical protein GGC64_004577 [Mycobacterium sp. OAS707]|nr:hypothetical protein [Mycobacterium sp. OAS707]
MKKATGPCSKKPPRAGNEALQSSDFAVLSVGPGMVAV